MKAAQLVGPKLFEFTDIEMPTIKDGECLVKLERVSICGSDIRHGYGPKYTQDHYPLTVGRPCHECAGTVVQSRTDAFHEGQRVIVLPGAGMGGLAEYLASNPGRHDRPARPRRPDGVDHVPALWHRTLLLPAHG